MSFEALKKRVLAEDEDFEAYVRELLEYERLDGDIVIGIAKKIATDGVASLSEKQLHTFIQHGIYEHLYVEECGRCGENIPWSEMITAAEDYGNCSYCQKIIDNDE